MSLLWHNMIGQTTAYICGNTVPLINRLMCVYTSMCTRTHMLPCAHTCIRLAHMCTHMHTFSSHVHTHAYIKLTCAHTCIRLAHICTHMHTLSSQFTHTCIRLAPMCTHMHTFSSHVHTHAYVKLTYAHTCIRLAHMCTHTCIRYMWVCTRGNTCLYAHGSFTHIFLGQHAVMFPTFLPQKSRTLPSSTVPISSDYQVRVGGGRRGRRGRIGS